MSAKKKACVFALLVLVNCTASLESVDTGDTDETNVPTRPDDGTDEDTLIVPSPLNCESVLMCDSHSVTNNESITMPSQLGGTIQDGVYKAVAGVNQPTAFIFQNNRYSNLEWNLLAANGTFDVNNTILTTNRERACSPNSDPGGNPDTTQTNYTYSIMGDDLFVEAECLGVRCDPVIQFRRVTALCSEDTLRSEECTLSSCSCRQLVGQGIPDRATGEDICAI